MSDEKNLLGMIGLSRAAGKTILGTDAVCEHLRKKGNKSQNAVLVLEASDTSENTHKKISDKCIYYNVKHIRLKSTCEILGRAVGKSATAAVAVDDPNFCLAILNKINES